MDNCERSKFGQSLYTLTFKESKFLMKHMWLYYLLNYTWGSIMTLIGWIVFIIVCLINSIKITECEKFGPCKYLMIGDNWGGLEMGVNFFVANNMGLVWTQHVRCHETGHTFQNAIWGPLAIFIIYLPSAVRYWYQKIRTKLNKDNKPYDLIWFEGNASDVGLYYYQNYLKA